MTDGPRIILQTERWRIVEWANGNKFLERRDGEDAMGVERWGKLEIADADNKARWLRDWIFEHVGKCPVLQGERDANHGDSGRTEDVHARA